MSDRTSIAFMREQANHFLLDLIEEDDVHLLLDTVIAAAGLRALEKYAGVCVHPETVATLDGLLDRFAFDETAA